MAKFVRKLNLTVLSVLMLVCIPVEAEDVSQDELAECAAKATAGEKLACYEALTVIREPAAGQAEAESQESAQQVAVEAEPLGPTNAVEDNATEPPYTPRESVVDAEPAAPMAVASEPAAESRPAPAQAAPETASPAAVASDSRSSVPDDLGREHLDRDDDGTQTFPITAIVSDVTESHFGRLYFHFSNGQIWRQNEPRRFRYPKNEEFEVTISRGMMGDYRLRVGGKGPMTRIRRVE